VVGRTFQELLLNLQSVWAVPRSTPEAESREVPALSEGSPVPRAYCITGGDTYRPRKIESCAGTANPPKTSMTLEAFWAYARTTDGLFPASPILKTANKTRRDKRSFQWISEEDAFEKLTVALCAAPILAYPKLGEFIVDTPWPLVRKRTIPTERPPLVDEICK
jgi:hypothetical protein